METDSETPPPIDRRVPSAASAAAIACFVAALALLLDAFFPEGHLWFGDLGARLRGNRSIDSRIALLDLESWPRTRDVLARAVRAIAKLNPRVIVLDVLLDEPRDRASDALLAAAIGETGRVILPLAIESRGGRDVTVPLLPLFVPKATGFANFTIDIDRVVRGLPLEHFSSLEKDATSVPALACAVLRACGETLPASQGEWSIDYCETTTSQLPIASLTRLLNDPSYSQGLEKIRFFEGKIALIGYLGIRYAGDGFLTPMSNHAMDRSPGVLLHANVLSNLLENRRRTELPRALVAILTLLCALAGAMAARRPLGLGWSLLIALGLTVLLAVPLATAARLGLTINAIPAAMAAVGSMAAMNLLSAQRLMRIPLWRRVVALFGIQADAEVALLNVVAESMGEQGSTRFNYQIHHGFEPGVPISLHHKSVTRESLLNVEQQLGALFRPRERLALTESLADLSSELGGEILGRELGRELAGLATKYLHLELAERELSIPWELADVDGKPLGELFAVSRSLVQKGRATKLPMPAQRENGCLALIVANPSPLAARWPPLPTAEREAESIARDLRALGAESLLGVELLTGGSATLEAVAARLASGEIDILHFSGHAALDSIDECQTGLVFPDGLLTPELLGNLLRPATAPPVVFTNACSTARGSSSSPHSIPAAFVTAGVRLFIGCLWEIETEAAARFAVSFYSSLAKGESASQSLLLARKAAAGPWMTHAAYVMYGDPRMRLTRPPGERPGRAGRDA